MAVFHGSGPAFLEELERDRNLVKRDIMRVTYRFRPNRTGVVYRCHVRASARIEGEVLIFEEHVGDVWGPAFKRDDVKVREKAEALHDRLVSGGRKLGLDVRAASYE